jgi:hypothetical protein
VGWNVTRDGNVINVNLSTLQPAEWVTLLNAVEAELAGAPTSRMVVQAGERPPPVAREALVESLSNIVRAENVEVVVTYDWGEDAGHHP